MTSKQPVSSPKTFTDRVRVWTGGLTSRLGHFFHTRGIHPDIITVVGTAIVAIAAVVLAQGEFFWGAVILMIGLPLDALDGAVARAMRRQGKFGAFWDSTLDRYADGLIFLALAYYYAGQSNQGAVLLSGAALLGTQLVSYTRARAEGLQVDCKVGLLSRLERVVILLIMLATGWIMPGLWVLAVGTHFTVAQRIWHVRRLLNESDEGDAS